MEDRIIKMYHSRFLVIIGKEENKIFFRDKPTFFTWGNTYLIERDDNGRYYLYYRGSLLKFILDRGKLSNIRFILENLPEK